MVLKATQDRVGTLIKDTITLLCKNGLEFQKRFTIEAVIGVTLDDGDIFLMSMNELIKSDNAPPSDQEDDGQAPDTTSEKRSTSKSKSSPHKSHKRKLEDPTTPDIKVKVKKEPGVSDQDESQDQEDSGGTVNPKTEELWGGGDPPSVAPDDSDSQQYYSEQMTADNQRTNNDDPQPDDDNDEDDENIDDEEDLVFIKEEASDTPSRPSCSRQRSFPGRSPQGQYSPGSASFSSPQGFSFSGVSLEALSQDSSSMWSQASQQQRGQNFSRVSTATSASFNQSPQQWQQQQSPAQGQQQDNPLGPVSGLKLVKTNTGNLYLVSTLHTYSKSSSQAPPQKKTETLPELPETFPPSQSLPSLTELQSSSLIPPQNSPVSVPPPVNRKVENDEAYFTRIRTRKHERGRTRIEKIRIMQASKQYIIRGGRLYYRGKKGKGNPRLVLCSVPERLRCLEICHENRESGAHHGMNITMKTLTKDYFWRSITEDVQKWIKECETCRQRKSVHEGNVDQDDWSERETFTTIGQ